MATYQDILEQTNKQRADLLRQRADLYKKRAQASSSGFTQHGNRNSAQIVDFTRQMDSLSRQIGGIDKQLPGIRRDVEVHGLEQLNPNIIQEKKLSAAEMEAGITPPGFETVRDQQTGKILDQYKLDPYAGEAAQALKQQAFATPGESPWARIQQQQQQLGEQTAKDQAAKQSMQAQSMAQAGLARMGGVSSGAKTSLARQSMRDLLGARQDISRQGMGERLGITAGDIGRQNQMLGNFAGAEGQAQSGNIQAALGDVTKKQAFDVNRYNQLMGAFGAGKTADAQAAAARGGGKK